MADKQKNTDVQRWQEIGDYWTNILQTGDGSQYGTVYMPGGGEVMVSNARQYYTNLYLSTGKDKQDYYQIADLLIGKGYMTNRADVNNFSAWLDKAVVIAAQADNRSQRLTPLDILERLPESETGADGSPRSFSTSTRTVNQSSRTDAKATLNNAYQQMLGRMANNKELAAFQKALNDLESKNATVSSLSGTTTSKGGTSSTSQTVRTTGGFNAGQFAQDWARSRPEYAETFAATTFMGVIDEMSRGGASLEGRVQ
jgi:hypothetical protein